MMNFDLRGAVIHNVHNLNNDELQNVIVDSIEEGEEKLLPGLGVLFEVIWNNSSDELKTQMLNNLKENLKTQ